MSFRVRAVFISHAGLPSGLTADGDYSDYMSDVDRELVALEANWNAYCGAQQPSDSDAARYQNAVARLEDLKDEAAAHRAKAPQKVARL